LFVYGSLKRGQRHHQELFGARFAGRARTLPECRLLAVGEYPALAVGDRSIEGELYEVETALLGRLEVFEGAAYERRLVRLDDGRTAQTYFAVDAQSPGAHALDTDTWPPTRAPA
jgi:gamma-glutamylcyclotransferase (GGCT)/AIG2-like uncharacterized protein YtfP